MSMPQTERSSRMSSQSTEVNVTNAALDAKSIKSIQLPTGWQRVDEAELVQFGVGVAQSPIALQKAYPTLKYRDPEGHEIFTPLSQILSFSAEPVQQR